MEFVVDLHLHSKYSRAVSAQMLLPEMARVAKQKGIDILSASDFTHPLWFLEMGRFLEESADGLYKLKGTKETEGTHDTKVPLFMMGVEIASIYKQGPARNATQSVAGGEKLRRIHNLVFAPNMTVAGAINTELKQRGCNLSSDGRPIIGLSARDLLELILEIDERCMLIPAHVWTPHFGVYGSASGFDSLAEAFGDLAGYVYGIETGLSSDPEMNWQMKELEHRSILSFSDAHSLPKMGREVTVFEMPEASYENIRLAIMRKGAKSIISSASKWTVPLGDTKGIKGEEKKAFGTSGTFDTSATSRILYSLEFYPEEGKYHFSGHRNCKVSIDPAQVSAGGNMCPVCKRRMTEGVLYRVQQLSDQRLLQRAKVKMSTAGIKWYTDKMKKFPPYIKLVPLNEIIAESLHSTVFSQKVKDMFSLLCAQFGSELIVLLKTPLQEVEKIAGGKVADGIRRVRGGDITIVPGYDGEYGKVAIWTEPVEKVEKVEKVDKVGKVEKVEQIRFV